MGFLLPASNAVDFLLSGRHSLLDVRSEGEFGKASIEGFENSPILNDRERHAVGLCYKQEGQAEAISLGHRLVDPLRDIRVADWLEIGSSRPENPLLVCCWRGGMRSQFATEWIEATGREALRIEGGYKSMRAVLMAEFLKPRNFLILSGRTGSGKTDLLNEIPILAKIDIESLAAHRGSSFGRLRDRPQPSQATFENSLSLGLRKFPGTILLEDESKVIGSLHLPEALYRSMASSQIVQVEVSLEKRCQTIYRDYVELVLKTGVSTLDLSRQLTDSVQALKRKLGGALTERVIKIIHRAFAADTENQAYEDHKLWIELLLYEYYDRAYDHSSARNQRTVAFRGNYEECQEWIINQYA